MVAPRVDAGERRSWGSGGVDGRGLVGGGVFGEVAGCFEVLFEDGGGDLGVELGAEQKHEAGDVEPGEKDDDGAE